jgi:hypothetical protein
MNKFSINVLVISFGLGMSTFPLAFASQNRVHAFLDGFQEVPALYSPASGQFTAQLSENEEVIEYTLTYAGFETDVTAAHIHFGQPATNGGIIAFLCNTGNGNTQEDENYANSGYGQNSDPSYENEHPPVETPACPPREGEVSGIITAEDVIGPTEQGIEPGEFHKLLEAINAGAAYVNVHSEAFPPGEIRGQLVPMDRSINDLTGNDLRENDLTGNDLRENNLTGNDLRENNLTGNDLRENNLRENNLRENNLRENNLRENNLRENDSH